jgi:hypothetical protein
LSLEAVSAKKRDGAGGVFVVFNSKFYLHPFLDLTDMSRNAGSVQSNQAGFHFISKLLWPGRRETAIPFMLDAPFRNSAVVPSILPRRRLGQAEICPVS